jgi:hypothetical protein
MDPSYFSIPDGLKFRGSTDSLQILGKCLDSSCITPPPLRENGVNEVGHNRDRNSHNPFLHTSPVQDAHSPDVGF